MGMGKEKYVSPGSAKIVLALEKAGFKFTRITIKTTPLMRQWDRDVRNYIMGIEEAHKEAGKSKLIFKSSLVPSLQPVNS
jgi:hypothetical protein